MPTPAKPTEADLSILMGLAPERAIEYMQRKGYHIGWDWRETLNAAHARSFTVAKVARMDILRDIRANLQDALKNGSTARQYIKDLQPTLERKGWWGKQEQVHPSTGETVSVQLGSPARLKTIYRTNMQSAYMAGRYADMQAAKATHPYWRYIAVMDENSRSSHAALHGKVFSADDPAWDSVMPPNGFNCRCRVQALTQAAVKRMGLAIEDGPKQMDSMDVNLGTDKDTNQAYKTSVTTMRVKGKNGEAQVFRTDPGFNGSPKASYLMDELLYRRAQQALPPAQAHQAVQDVLLAPIRQQAWEALVDKALAGATKNQGTTSSMAVGVMRTTDIAFAKAKGAPIASGLIHIDERLISGPKALRHQAIGNALTPAQWHALPQALTAPEMVLWDTEHKTMLYVLAGSADNGLTKLVVQFSKASAGPRGVKVDDAASVFKVNPNDLRSGLISGLYQLVRKK